MTAVKKAAPSPKKGGTAKRAAPASRKTSAERAKRAPTKKTKKGAPAARTGSAKKATSGVKKPVRPSKTATSRAKAPKKPVAAAKRSAPAPKGPARSAKKPAPTTKATGSTKAGAERATPRVAKKPPSAGPYAKEEKFLEEQATLLRAERAIYEGQAQDLRAEADSLALEREPGDVQFDEESGEGGTVTVDRERNLALSAQAGAAVEEIDDALRKIERKTYGTCERCHQAIPKARLRALPYARLCVACKSGGLSRR